MRMLKVVALSTAVATGVFGLTALASSAYAQGTPTATDATPQGDWQGAPTSNRWRADTTMGPRSGWGSSSVRRSGYGLGPGSNGPSSINNGQ